MGKDGGGIIPYSSRRAGRSRAANSQHRHGWSSLRNCRVSPTTRPLSLVAERKALRVVVHVHEAATTCGVSTKVDIETAIVEVGGAKPG
jgi:hypothetical protein